jgi:ATP-dependent DNA helicase PIF1
MCSISAQSIKASLLRETALIVWDEAPMTNRWAFEALDRTLRDIRKNDENFGGVVVVCGGDFRQILPVVKRGTAADVVDACLKKSYLWEHVTCFHLTRNMRLSAMDADAIAFAAMQLDIGNGTFRVAVRGSDVIEIPYGLRSKASTWQTFVPEIYPDLVMNFKNPQYLTQRCILTTTNSAVDDLNKKIFEMLSIPSNQVTVSKSVDSIQEEEHVAIYPFEFLNSLNISGIPPHRIILAPGVPIMLLRNLDLRNGHCNGSRYIVRAVKSHVIDAEIAVGSRAGQRIFIPRMTLIPSGEESPFTMKRRQFPVRVAFAMTINKSQGQTFDRVVWESFCQILFSFMGSSM